MSDLTTRKTKLTFVTGDTVREKGKFRPVVIDAKVFIAFVRLQGTRKAFPVSYAAVYHLAARIAADQERAEKKAKRKTR